MAGLLHAGAGGESGRSSAVAGEPPGIVSISFRSLTLMMVLAGAIMAGIGTAHAFDEKNFEKQKSSPWAVFRFGFSAYKHGHKAEAIEAYRYAADNGQVGASWKLAHMYAEGDGVARNDYEAFKFFNRIVQDDVEIGACSCIDRGAFRDTVIGEGTKIDNMVQIGHNVAIGRHCIIVATCGIAGSATLGDYVVLGARVGVNDHATIGEGAQIAATSNIHGDVPPGARWGGTPAKPLKAWAREMKWLERMAADKVMLVDRGATE